MPEAQHSVLEIHLGALRHNYQFLKNKLHDQTKFLAVVKAFVYGNHSMIVPKTLEDLGVDYMAVAYVHEGVTLREAGLKTPIMVFHPQPASFKQAIEYDLEPTIYSPRTLKQFLHTANEQNQYPVHLKFNTGLNRVGFWENDVDNIFNTLGDSTCLEIRSVFSHLAASDDPSEEAFTQKQIRSFDNIYKKVSHRLQRAPLKHILNTSGILNYPEAQYDMVRSGIGLHGYGNDPKFDRQLKPLATLKTVISQIHKIEPNETVGYNRVFTSDDFLTTATLPIGHADGIGRHFGLNKAHVLVNGKAAPIIGNVCMDMMMVDITGIPCHEGDEVIVFGGAHSAEDFASTGNTISYELITGISPRIQRVVIP